jgi:uncharacterized protein
MSVDNPANYGLDKATVRRILDLLAESPEIRRVILFGSRAKGNYRPGSDIDLCLDAPRLNLSRQLDIETRLDDLLLPWKIDLVQLQAIDNPALLEHIERVGVVLDETPSA